APAWSRLRDGVLHPRPHCLRFEHHDLGARRPCFDRHAGRRWDPIARRRGRSGDRRRQLGQKPCEDSLVPRLAGRYRTLPEYPLATIPQKKRELAARGVDVIDLGAGDADLPPPASVVDALTKAAQTPALNRYGFGLGLVKFRETVSEWMQRRFGL